MAENSGLDAKRAQLRRYADLIERESGKAVRPYRADGFVNLLNKYGTSKDTSEQYRFVPDAQVPDDLLTMFYEGNGLFAKIIDAPAEEAVKHGFVLSDVSDQKVEDFYQEALEELDFEETMMTALKWARLFGGSIAVMLINDGGALEEPLNWRRIRSIDGIRVFDRSLIQPDYESMFSYDPSDPFRARGSRLGMPERYQVFSKYGSFTVHDSRCLVFQNGILPENATNSIYQFWGEPEYVRLNRAIRDAEIAHGSAPKLLDRSVQAIYKMKDLSMELATEEGEERLLRRLQIIDMARGLMNSIAIDSEGEEYDFRTFQFSGVNDVIGASCNMLSAVSNIPQVILFGQKVGGLGNGDDTSMENWYNYIERNQKRQLKPNIRYLLSVIFQAGLATGEVDEVPKIKIEFNPLWSMTEAEKADLELKKEQTKLAKAQTAQAYVTMQAIDASEVRKKLADSDEFDVERILDEYEDEDLFPEEAVPEEGDGTGGIFEQGSFADYGEGVGVQAHNADPQDGGNAPTAAPAATKLPQDMSDEEVVKKATQGHIDGLRVDAIFNTAPDIRASVGVLVVKDGKVLCGVRGEGFAHGQICGPGGHVKSGETYEQAAFRETEEEFGISPKELIPLGFGPLEEDTGLTPAVFLCTEYEGEPYSRDGEMEAPVFLGLDELRKIVGPERMFPPFSASLKLMEETVLRVGEAVSEDGGPGSGNFGHEGVPGQIGGSAPSSKVLNKKISDAFKQKDASKVRDEVGKSLRDAPAGAKVAIGMTTYTKKGNGRYSFSNAIGDTVYIDSDALAKKVDPKRPETAPKFEEIKAEDIATEKIKSGELKPEDTSVKVSEETKKRSKPEETAGGKGAGKRGKQAAEESGRSTAQEKRKEQLKKLPENRKVRDLKDWEKEGLEDGSTYTFGKLLLETHPDLCKAIGFDFHAAVNSSSAWIDATEIVGSPEQGGGKRAFVLTDRDNNKYMFDTDMMLTGEQSYYPEDYPFDD